MSDPLPVTPCDVTVIGGGLAGKAAALHLVRAGLKVVCIEPPQAVRPPVGESLDWSAPALLSTLGLTPESLLASRIATWKRHVTLKMRDGCDAHYVPSEWLGGPPFYVNLATLHVERTQLDDEILKMVVDEGVTFVRDRVVDLETDGRTIRAVQTESGARFTSPWLIDASGIGASLVARKLGLPTLQYGPTKVAMWTYFKVTEEVEGTTLYMDPQPAEYLEWLWEIPVSPGIVSVGYIAPGTAIKGKRDVEGSVENIFRQQLAKFSRFDPLLQQGALSEVNVTSFRCRVHTESAGPNWLIAGEAASLVDPMTSNGVTAALRHAAEAAALILKFRTRGELPQRARKAYSSRILQMAKFFNEGIEKILYEPVVRNHIGLSTAGTAYTSPAWSMNVVYARLGPTGLWSTWILNAMLGFFRMSASILYWYCGLRKSPVARQQCKVT
ncbi:MAG: tryptophan 7-halogenase [Acidobacteria bacterium]|nr:tryptophan 7-halogenase [Acidobacteriota bacterium]